MKAFYNNIKENQSQIELIEPLFVMLTAFKTPHFEKHIKEIGFNDCYEKPIETEQLFQIFVQASD